MIREDHHFEEIGFRRKGDVCHSESGGGGVILKYELTEGTFLESKKGNGGIGERKKTELTETNFHLS